MDKILSQDEVDALLRGVMSGDVDTAPVEDETEGCKSYDLINQERIIRGRMPTLEMINDRFARLIAVSWGTALRKPIELSIVGTQVIKFGEFLKKIPLPSSLTIFSMDPLRGHGLFVMDSFLVYVLVDHFFGGAGQTHVKPEGRDFTLVQQRIIRTVVIQAIADLEKAWSPLMPLKVQFVRSESNPQFAMIVSVSEIVLAITFKLHIGEFSRDIHVAYPYSMLEPHKDKLTSGFFADQAESDSGWSGRFKEALKDCPVKATVELGTAKLSLKDVMHFCPGDVLVLEQSPGDPLTCTVERLPKFLGAAGVLKGNQAFRITQVIPPPQA
jgi:flagellar motor switch protein FliM